MLWSLCSRSYGFGIGIGLCNSNPGRTHVLEVLSRRNESASPRRSFIRVYLKRASIDVAGSIHVSNNLDHIGGLAWNVHGVFNRATPVGLSLIHISEPTRPY